MNTKSWRLTLEDGHHVVQIRDSETAGLREVLIDGRIVHQARQRFPMNGTIPLRLGRQAIEIIVGGWWLQRTYDLTVDGLPFGKVRPESFAGRRRKKGGGESIVAASQTVELPMTTAERDVIHAYRLRRIQTLANTYAIVVGLVALALFAHAYPGELPTPWLTAIGWVLAITAGIGLLVMVYEWRHFEPDLASQRFLRTTGSVDVNPVGFGGYRHRIRLLDTEFEDGLAIGAALPALSLATVDHSPKRHVIFQVRDETGTVIYRDPDYWPVEEWLSTAAYA